MEESAFLDSQGNFYFSRSSKVHPERWRHFQREARLMLMAFDRVFRIAIATLDISLFTTTTLVRNATLENVIRWINQRTMVEWSDLITRLDQELPFDRDWETCLGNYPKRFDLSPQFLWVLATYDYAYGANATVARTRILDDYRGRPTPSFRLDYVIEPAFTVSGGEDSEEPMRTYVGAQYRLATSLDGSDIAEGINIPEGNDR